MSIRNRFSIGQPAAPAGVLTQVEIDGATIVGFGLVALGIIGIVIQAAAGNPKLFPISSTGLAEVTAAAAVATSILRQLASGFQNKGVAVQTGVLTRVESYLSTYIGYGLTALTFAASAIASVSGYSTALGISDSRLALIGTAIGIATGVGRQIQSILQNSGTAAASFAESKQTRG